MKTPIVIFLFLIIVLMAGCSKKVSISNSEIDDDYVLVEFAAKLEEDYHRIESHPIEIDKVINNYHP